MSEQFFKAYGVSAVDLAKVVGSQDETLIKRAKRKRSLFEEVTELLEEWGDGLTIDEVVSEIVSGKLVPKHAYEYTRVLQIVAATIGTSLKPDEDALPGRGWHELGPAWAHWGLKSLGKTWSNAHPWPWTKTPKGGAVHWPVPVLIARSELGAIDKELKAFDPKVIAARGVPKTVDRFGEGEWEMDDLGAELKHFVAAMKKWVTSAQGARSDLLLWIDGQQ